MQFDVYYLKTHNKAVRFRFVIEQFFGVTGQPLYLHCLISTCQRNDAPQPTVFDCHTHGQYCPDKKQEYVTKGPFVVWPVASKRDRDNLKIRKGEKKHGIFSEKVFLLTSPLCSVSVLGDPGPMVVL